MSSNTTEIISLNIWLYFTEDLLNLNIKLLVLTENEKKGQS